MVLGTATNNAAMTDTLGGLAHRGELIVIGINPEPFEVNPFALLGAKMYGHACGTSKEVEETSTSRSSPGYGQWSKRCGYSTPNRPWLGCAPAKLAFRMVLTTGR